MGNADVVICGGVFDLLAEGEISYGVDVIVVYGQTRGNSTTVIACLQSIQIQRTLHRAGLFCDKARHLMVLVIASSGVTEGPERS